MFNKILKDAHRARQRANAAAKELAECVDPQDDMKCMADAIGTPAAEEFREHVRGRQMGSDGPFKPLR